MHKQSNILSDHFLSAFEFAYELHRVQLRKGSEIPYMSHLMGVAALVMEDGGDETESIAALLHDSVEDQGGTATLEKVKQKFGERVASIVEFCTDSMETPKPPWKDRKLAVIEKVGQAGDSEFKVLIADKLHNLRSIRNAVQRYGEGVWGRFKGGHEGSMWYYRQLLTSFKERGKHPYLDEIEVIINHLE
jgi:(p)ppGpp synthase/HD superfamily hydrolase